jgi:hypothetical protein
MSDARRHRRSKDEQDRILSMELEMTFPASDPPASTQPASGVTGATDRRARPSLAPMPESERAISKRTHTPVLPPLWDVFYEPITFAGRESARGHALLSPSDRAYVRLHDGAPRRQPSRGSAGSRKGRYGTQRACAQTLRDRARAFSRMTVGRRTRPSRGGAQPGDGDARRRGGDWPRYGDVQPKDVLPFERAPFA